MSDQRFRRFFFPKDATPEEIEAIIQALQEQARQQQVEHTTDVEHDGEVDAQSDDRPRPSDQLL